jgi:polyhydroxyalkanoate synthesis regulator phasin
MAQQLQKKFIGNNQVDGSKILLENGQSVKIKDSTGTEVELVKLGASDEVLVKGQEVALKANLDQEIVDRAAGDAATLASAQAYAESYTDTEIDAFIAGPFAGEIADRQSGDANTLSSANSYTDAEVLAEETARIAGDASTLSSANSYTDQEVLAEETARIAADSNLQSQIDAISGGGSGSISALQSELDATQAGAGLGIDGSYSPNVSASFIGAATSLAEADNLLDDQLTVVSDVLDQEIIDRQAADQALQTQIDNVLSNVDAGALDSLTEIVTAFQAADASLNGAITALSTGLSADIDAEEAARIAADSALQGEIDAEEVARAAADTTLQNNINAESSARQAADNALDGRVDVLESRVWVKEKFSISNGQTSVTLSFAPFANSMTAHVDRLAIHEGASEDFTVSGTTMTFLNDLVSPGQSQIGNGDTVYVKYQKNA